MSIRQHLPAPVKSFLRRALRVPRGYEFFLAQSIQEQTIRFACCSRNFVVKADYTTPLYEIVAEVVDYDCYQLSSLDFTNAADRCIFDIGANVGVTTLVLAQIPGVRVFSFEPLPGNCSLLEQNLRLNGVTNAEVVSSAVCDVDGSVFFEKAPDSGGGYVVWESSENGRSRIKVKSLRLETALRLYAPQGVYLMKVDCEGSEYSIVDQITPEMARRIENLTFEVHERDSPRNLRVLSRKLEVLGYRLSFKPEMFGRAALNHVLATWQASR